MTEPIDLFGIPEGGPRSLLEFIVNNPDVTAADISTFADEWTVLSDPALVGDGIWWAEKLDFIYPSGGGWRVDDFLCRILRPSGENSHGA